jgi:hypothetical protein
MYNPEIDILMPSCTRRICFKSLSSIIMISMMNGMIILETGEICRGGRRAG